mmetsp:Transcript_109794/g.245243  ORF Transcript_109794/g.245243 Transcript_109794/m.245243 type:complete len:240 (+) Transcript_109794:245-964(+)
MRMGCRPVAEKAQPTPLDLLEPPARLAIYKGVLARGLRPPLPILLVVPPAELPCAELDEAPHPRAPDTTYPQGTSVRLTRSGCLNKTTSTSMCSTNMFPSSKRSHKREQSGYEPSYPRSKGALQFCCRRHCRRSRRSRSGRCSWPLSHGRCNCPLDHNSCNRARPSLESLCCVPVLSLLAHISANKRQVHRRAFEVQCARQGRNTTVTNTLTVREVQAHGSQALGQALRKHLNILIVDA